MRIISGSRRGRKLLEFDGEYVRPTTDRVKESMFNLIQGFVSDAVVYDAFAGTGALGLEALSRGAECVVCTDTDIRSVGIVKQNYENCDFMDRVEIHNISADDYLKRSDRKFDIVFMDPPYNKGLISPLLKIIYERKLLSDEGIIVLERDGEGDSYDSEGFSVLKERKYGRTVITVLSYIDKE